MRLLLICLVLLPSLCFARSVYTPRDSGTEPPGGPRAPEAIPSSGSFGRTAEGGMGYVDAYGNTIDNRESPKPPKKRLPRGAFGRPDRDAARYDRPLPDPARSGPPAWSFK
ncbi:MAG: translation initiation factor IF-2 [Desulfovibrionaceae bacterium]|nr:translation initiation factor IF-2 [Desulfovibrionaceae bacterium]